MLYTVFIRIRNFCYLLFHYLLIIEPEPYLYILYVWPSYKIRVINKKIAEVKVLLRPNTEVR